MPVEMVEVKIMHNNSFILNIGKVSQATLGGTFGTFYERVIPFRWTPIIIPTPNPDDKK